MSVNRRADPASTTTDRRRGGPPLTAPAAAYAVITLAAVATSSGTLPTDDAPTTLATLQANAGVAQVSATLLIGSIAPLAVFTAAMTHRLQALGARVAGPLIGMTGGILTSVALLISGLTATAAATAASTGPLADAGVVKALDLTSFLAGGVGFALSSALLLAGIAVPSAVLHLVPRPLAVAGLVIAAAGVLALLSLLVPALTFLLPIARFGGVLWIVAMSIAMPVKRRTPVSGE